MSALEYRPGSSISAIDVARSALLLDIDGTLLDIAENPDAVSVPAELHDVLARLHTGFEGAVALISGRSVSRIDVLFPGLPVPVVGCHGAEMRLSAESGITQRVPPLPARLRRRLARLAEAHGGLFFEDKLYAMAVHYRAAPGLAPLLATEIAAICAEERADIDILHGKHVFEVKPKGIDKGGAVRALLAIAPFRDRHPIFVGDDVTDEAAFAVLGEYSGIGISVGSERAGATFVFASPQDVRRWLLSLSDGNPCAA